MGKLKPNKRIDGKTWKGDSRHNTKGAAEKRAKAIRNFKKKDLTGKARVIKRMSGYFVYKRLS